MGQLLKLEVFESVDLPEGPALMTPEDIEALRLTAYEAGYKAGWDDGEAQHLTDLDAARAELAQKIEALSFGYFEARAHVVAGLRPLLEAIVETVVPQGARAAVIPQVVEALLPLAMAAADRPVTLRLAPGGAERVQRAVEGLVTPPLAYAEDPALDPAEAVIAQGAHAVHVDLSGAAIALGRAIDEFYQLDQQEVRRA